MQEPLANEYGERPAMAIASLVAADGKSVQ